MSESPQPAHPHGSDAADPRVVHCAVLTVSDTRTPETDQGGPLIAELLAADNHRVVALAIMRDEPAEIRAQVEEWLANPQIQVILLTGGTGVGRRDNTVEAVRQLLDVELEGFGELFRLLSYQQIGSAAMLSRATAGLVCHEPDAGGDSFVFLMPGSPKAVRLAMQKLIVPELRHLVGQRWKGG